MTDEELIKRLRGDHPDYLTAAAADRIEALVNEAVLSKAAYEGVSSLLLSVQQDCIKERQRAERLEAALRNIAEGNLGDAPWQANYAKIKDTARAALKGADHE